MVSSSVISSVEYSFLLCTHKPLLFIFNRPSMFPLRRSNSFLVCSSNDISIVAPALGNIDRI